MKATSICLALLATLAACAEQDNTTGVCSSSNVACGPLAGASGSLGGAASTAGSGGLGVSGTGVAGTGLGGDSGAVAGGPGAGTGGGSGSASAIGGASGATAGGGTSAGGTSAGGTSAGGTSAGGMSAGGMSAGGTSAGGMGGSPAAGGSGGAMSALCITAIPERTSWAGTAMPESTTDLAGMAFDASLTTRFATGTKMVGSEWLQIDFTTKGTVDQLTILTSNGDYGRHLKIRMSNTSQDMNAPVLAEADGMMGLQTFNFIPTTARFVLIQQTGTLATGITWWSVYDVNAYCN